MFVHWLQCVLAFGRFLAQIVQLSDLNGSVEEHQELSSCRSFALPGTGSSLLLSKTIVCLILGLLLVATVDWLEILGDQV